MKAEEKKRQLTTFEVEDIIVQFRSRYRYLGELVHMGEPDALRWERFVEVLWQMWRDWDDEIEPLIYELIGSMKTD